jgi:hypothetical protein
VAEYLLKRNPEWHKFSKVLTFKKKYIKYIGEWQKFSKVRSSRELKSKTPTISPLYGDYTQRVEN